MTEKTKNDYKPKRTARKNIGYGCAVLFLASLACSIYIFRQMSTGGFLLGPGLADICVGRNGIYNNFKVAGHIVDAQGQPIAQADVKLGNKGTKDCFTGASYRTQTTEDGEFSFGPTLFAYTDQFSISASIEGCQPSVTYNDFPPDDEPVTIVLDCITEATTQEAQ